MGMVSRAWKLPLCMLGLALALAACSARPAAQQPVATPPIPSFMAERSGGLALALDTGLPKDAPITLRNDLQNTEKQYTGAQRDKLVQLAAEAILKEFPIPTPASPKAGYSWCIPSGTVAVYFQGTLVSIYEGDSSHGKDYYYTISQGDMDALDAKLKDFYSNP